MMQGFMVASRTLRSAGTVDNESDQSLSNIIEQLVYWTGVVLKLACVARAVLSKQCRLMSKFYNNANL
jgi:hypothetical protein